MEPAHIPASLLERVRARAAGLLEPAEADALQRELDLDRDAAAFAEQYDQVHRATSALRDEPAPCRVEFAQLEARVDAAVRVQRAGVWRKAAAAAALVAGTAALWTLTRDSGEDAPLQLTAISLDAAPADAPRDEFPALLASYAPIDAGLIRWVDDLETGEAIARAAERPLLLFGMFETCPLCIQMKAEGLRDAEVVGLLEDFVPVQIDLLELGDDERAVYFERGYPLFEVRTAEGELVHSFPGFHDARAFVDNLNAGVGRFAAPKPSWESLQERARTYAAGLRAEDAGELGAAQQSFAALEREAAATTLGRAAHNGLARIASAAREALLAARDLAARDADRASRSLSLSAQRFEGSAYALDFAAARAVLERTGQFPELVGAE